MADTRIMPCKCQHEYQDKKYGKGMRVHNKGGSSKTQSAVWVCSVCGARK